MNFDFESFLSDAKISCKSKSDLTKRLIDEEEAVANINVGESSMDKELYLRRLNNAKFCIEKGAIKEKDKYNPDLLELLKRLK
jgi:hypothetical protein